MNTKKLLRAIWTVIKVISGSALIGFISYKIVSLATLGLITWLNNEAVPIIIICIIGFIVLVKAFYDLDVE